jgi:gliding motility-associated lipoprotein GldH
MKHALLATFAILLLLVSCDSNRVYEDNRNIEGASWYYKSTVPFDVQIKDTLKWYNVYANVRVSTDYKYSNIFMWVHAISPDKKEEKRRIEIRLADESGKWIGSGLGDLYDYRFPVFSHIRFPQSGFYRFELEQNMRDDTLMHVKSVGVRVEEEIKQ